MKVRIKNNGESKNTEHILNAMNIYLTEYIHRDTLMWKHNFTFFVCTLLVILLPNLLDYFEMTLPPILDKRPEIFPFVGILMSFVFFIRAINLGKRFQAISLTYNDLIRQLPENLQRFTINNKLSYKYKRIHVYVLPSIMFVALVSISLIFLI